MICTIGSGVTIGLSSAGQEAGPGRVSAESHYCLSLGPGTLTRIVTLVAWYSCHRTFAKLQCLEKGLFLVESTY